MYPLTPKDPHHNSPGANRAATAAAAAARAAEDAAATAGTGEKGCGMTKVGKGHHGRNGSMLLRGCDGSG